MQEIFENWFKNVENEDKFSLLKYSNKQIEENFSKELQFGTAGIRGINGLGPNKMNKYLIRKITQGFCEYLKDTTEVDKPSIDIAYDTRLYSKFFAEEAARVCLANAINVRIHDTYISTPELSFDIRLTNKIGGMNAGIMMTASHNPKNYSGYKIYNSKGSQFTSEETEIIYNEYIKNTENFTDVDTGKKYKIKYDETIDIPWVSISKYGFHDLYINSVAGKINSNVMKTECTGVYSALNGTGFSLFNDFLIELNINDVHYVKEQISPDPNFSTCPSPNPEDEEAYNLAIKLAEEINAEYILTNDPDADRLGVMIRNKNNKLQLLTGNQLGLLFVNYIINEKQMKGYIIKSIVSTQLIDRICEDNNLDCINVYTGFKNIADKIDNNFLFGFEESGGYLINRNVRDKDGISSAILFIEMIKYYKQQGKQLYKVLEEIYEKYGYCFEKTLSVPIDNDDVLEDLITLEFFNKFGKISKIYDYESLEIKDNKNNIIDKITDLSSSNVVKVEYENSNTIFLRSSGTEPKIKIYISVWEKNTDDAEKALEELSQKAKNTVEERDSLTD